MQVFNMSSLDTKGSTKLNEILIKPGFNFPIYLLITKDKADGTINHLALFRTVLLSW